MKGVPATGILKDERFKVFIDAAGNKKARSIPVLANSNEMNTKVTDFENEILLNPKVNIKTRLIKLNDELNASLKEAEDQK